MPPWIVQRPDYLRTRGDSSSVTFLPWASNSTVTGTLSERVNSWGTGLPTSTTRRHLICFSVKILFNCSAGTPEKSGLAVS